MSLTPRLVAIQGIGFSAITMAVQGLIAQIQEELRSQVYGSGKNLPVPADWNTKQSPADDDQLIRKVLDKWEFIESIQRADQENRAHEATETVATIATVNPLVIPDSVALSIASDQAPADPTQQDDSESIKRSEQRKRNARALALIFAEA